MKKILVILFCFAFAPTLTQAQFQDSLSPQGIWFKKTEKTQQRILYSQAVLWPSSISGHIALYIAKDDFDWSKAVRWSMYKKTFSTKPRIDEDHWSWNYEAHPYMGSLSYLAYRNKGGSVVEASLGAALNSVIYEYIIAGGTQPASLNDMIVTPVAGSLLGEGLYQVKKLMLRDHTLSLFEKIILTIIDPVELFYYGFNYKKICSVKYR